MIKINKIQDKKVISVLAQENCTTSGGKPPIYQPGQDCLDDCTKLDKPAYWESHRT